MGNTVIEKEKVRRIMRKLLASLLTGMFRMQKEFLKHFNLKETAFMQIMNSFAVDIINILIHRLKQKPRWNLF